jgi:hypothetical protein
MATMITKDLYTYSIRILRQDSILRDHEFRGGPKYTVKSKFPDLIPLPGRAGPRVQAATRNPRRLPREQRDRPLLVLARGGQPGQSHPVGGGSRQPAAAQ